MVGPELRMAGFEAIVISGQAEQPVYLWIQDGQAEIRDANHLWGKEPEQAQALIRQELGDDKIRVLQIGLGGENLVRYAGLTNELRHFNGRTGMGAVMGSKRLKAIAVRGRRRVIEAAFDSRKVSELGKELSRMVKSHPQSWDLYDKGTLGLVAGLNAGGILPTHNFLEGAFEQVDQVKWDVYEKELLTGRGSCYACSVRCKREVALDDRYQVSRLMVGRNMKQWLVLLQTAGSAICRQQPKPTSCATVIPWTRSRPALQLRLRWNALSTN
jgi:aldehyde:ferredoxin oxidoreductase